MMIANESHFPTREEQLEAECDRLKAANAELLAALEMLRPCFAEIWGKLSSSQIPDGNRFLAAAEKADAAIAKARIRALERAER